MVQDGLYSMRLNASLNRKVVAQQHGRLVQRLAPSDGCVMYPSAGSEGIPILPRFLGHFSHRQGIDNGGSVLSTRSEQFAHR